MKKSCPNKNNTCESAQCRLLEAAERLFAEKGFDGTSIRDITSSAGCNLAAVNYHFGNKDNLYLEVFRKRFAILRNIRIEAINRIMNQQAPEPTIEDLIREFSRAFLNPLVDQENSDTLLFLIHREMYEKKIPINIFMEEMVIPVQNLFSKAVTRLIGDIDQEMIPVCTMSLIGQLMHSLHIKEWSKESSEPILSMDTDKMIEHIVRFSVAGFKAFTKGDLS